MFVVYWDIDGTLLTTCRQGIGAWERAVRHVLGVALDLQRYDSAGKPDRAIARELIQLAGARSSRSLESRLVDSYVDALPQAIDPSIGGALPNVASTLDHLRATDGWHSSFVTGNMREAASIKLAAYGLGSHLSIGGFGEDGYDRPSIAGAARRRVRERSPVCGEVIVGDTPHDIACGRDLDMPAVAVATGPFTVEQLARCSPSITLPQLPAPADFTSLVTELLS